MSDELFIPRVYEPLFKLIEGHLPQVNTVICTGGRYSGKSFGANLALAHGVSQFGHRLLHSRYTMVSASQSIIPDFQDKLDILGANDYYKVNKNTIESIFDKSRVFFRGIKTGAKTQDSALKSLSDVSIFCVEEASEIPTFEEWEKIDLSIRALDVQPFSILILNPTTTSHWIYQKFFKDKGVPAGFNGIVDGVLYIHSTWKDLKEEFISPKHLKKFKEAEKFYRENQLHELTEPKDVKLWMWYNDVILGGWKSSVDNLIFEHWTTFREFPKEKPIYKTLGLDFGYNDPTVLVESRVYKEDIYIKVHFYKPKMSNKEIADGIKKAWKDSNDGVPFYTVADNQAKSKIYELNLLGAFVVPCRKGAGSITDGIDRLNGYNLHIHFESVELQHEANHYCYVEKVSVDGARKTVPVDDHNHGWDATRYSISLY